MYGLLRPRFRTTPDERFDQRADMCSLCDALHQDYGISGRALNNYDAIFLATLTAAQNPQLRQNQLDPVRGACTRFLKSPEYQVEPYFEFAANVSVLLAALRLGDKLADEKGWTGKLNLKNRTLAKWLKPRLKTAQAKAASFGLEKLDPQAATQLQKSLEAKTDATLDELAGVTIEWLSEILAATARLAKRPENEQPLRELGQVLGRQIYLFDAVDDLDDDLKTGDFNALLDSGELVAQIPNRSERRVEAARLGETWLAEGHLELAQKLAKIQLEDNLDLVRTMLLDNRMLWRFEPSLAELHAAQVAPVESRVEVRPEWQLPLINRAEQVHAPTCKSKKCQSNQKSAHRVGFLGVAIGLAALPLQMNGCDCCCDICAAEEGAACCCLEIECCNCCCGNCGGGGGGRRYRRGYYDQYPPNYPPPGYGPPRRRRRFW